LNYPVFIPEFHTYEGRINSGHCFCAAHDQSSFIITCLHLFGPGGGLKTNIKPEELSSSVYEYLIHDPITDEILGNGSAPYSNVNSYPLNPHANELDASGDIAVFPVPEESKITPLNFSEKNLEIGDNVDVLGIDRFNIESVTIKKFPCTVLDIDDKYLILKPKKEINIPGLSGAPIINENDDVIGMIAGGFRDKMGRNRIICNPAKAILEYL
jgi:hypothetical protein